LHSCGFSDEINFDKLKKVGENLMEGVGIWTPVTLTCFMINLNLEVGHFINHHNITVSGFSGGVTVLTSKIYKLMTNLNAYFYY
jgi:hypothetical protein